MSRPKSLWVAYGLWLFGMHYLYLGQPVKLMVYWLTGWGLGIWALLDLFMMPQLVKKANLRVATGNTPPTLKTGEPNTPENPSDTAPTGVLFAPTPTADSQEATLREQVREAIESLEKARTLVEKHFALSELVEIAFRARHIDPKFAEMAQQAAWEMVGIAHEVAATLKREARQRGEKWYPLAHVGYQRLAIDLERSGEYDKCIEICLKAHREGWWGDWERRITRCLEKKRKKEGSK